MYLEFFNLKEEPFNLTPDADFFFLSRQHEGALESLLYGIRQKKGFMVLTGEVGTGKTTLCRELMNRLDDNVDIAVILNPLISEEGLLRAITQDFGIEIADNQQNVEGYVENLTEFLLTKVEEGRNAVVLVDEAQNLSLKSLEMLRLISNIETDKQKLLQIVLVGQPELLDLLQEYKIRQLNQRINIRRRVEPFDLEETKRYIYFRLTKAGASGQLGFEPKALKNLYEYTKGNPRMLNAVCDRTLLTAYSHRTRVINRKILREAIQDISGQTVRSWWQKIWRS